MNRTLVAHQPYFFPWLGYFNKLAYATHFLVLDDVQYRTRFYHNRALIRGRQGAMSWLTLPVAPTHRCPILDVWVGHEFDISIIDNKVWDAYRNAPFFKKLWPDMREIISANTPVLIDINLSLINHIVTTIGLSMPTVLLSSAGSPFSNATDRLQYGCRTSQADWIIMGEGGSLDCHNLDVLRMEGVKFVTQSYIDKHPKYQQLVDGFIPGLSILDALMCVGPDKTRELVISPWTFVS